MGFMGSQYRKEHYLFRFTQLKFAFQTQRTVPRHLYQCIYKITYISNITANKFHVFRVCVFVCLRVGMCTCLSAFVYVSCVLKQLDLMHVVSFTTWSLCRKPSKHYNLNVIFFIFFCFLINLKLRWQDRALRTGYACSSAAFFHSLAILSIHSLTPLLDAISVGSTEIAVGSFVQKLAGIGSRSSARDSSHVPTIGGSMHLNGDRCGIELVRESPYSRCVRY